MTVISSQHTEKNPLSLALTMVNKFNFYVISCLCDFIHFASVWLLRKGLPVGSLAGVDSLGGSRTWNPCFQTLEG